MAVKQAPKAGKLEWRVTLELFEVGATEDKDRQVSKATRHQLKFADSFATGRHHSHIGECVKNAMVEGKFLAGLKHNPKGQRS